MNYNAQPEGLHVLPECLPHGVDDDQAQEFLDLLWAMLLQGGDPEFDEMVDYICEYPFFSESDPSQELEPLGVEEAERLAEYLIEQRIAQQRTFGEVPPMPITQAFAELEELGVIAKENFACCQTCGHDEILLQVRDPQQWKGYVFFHQQDAEDIFETGEGALAFGHAPGGTDLDIAELINGTILPVLHKHHITATWNGSPRTRILLSGVQLYYPLEPLTPQEAQSPHS
ncbi:hypothetical protein [Corynebacterium sp.]|uniref:DUF6891 domain-containing protein n=1 Tax=Corynebacterium sp. TaxID=1720 RepID=UPI0026DAE1E3|nr:hypothetical protein [Corynebacterium sp.]MDO5077175.1 hypothetical protein [Corynebacterium sp.]